MCEDILDRPCREDAPLAQQQGVTDRRGELLQMVGDGHGRQRGPVQGKMTHGVDEVLARGQIECVERLVEQQQGRIGHEGAGDEDPGALTARTDAVRAVGEVLDPKLGEQRAGALAHFVAVRLPQRLDGAGVAGEDGGAAGQVPRDALGGGDVTDAGAKLPHIDAAEPVTEDVDRARGGERGGADEPQDAGLARSVGAEQRPVLAGPDGPADAVEDDLAGGVATHAHAVEGGDDAPVTGAVVPVHAVVRPFASMSTACTARRVAVDGIDLCG